jgi:hypothetical protein
MHAPTCPCPACKLLRWQAQVYRNQFYVDPSLPEERLETCPMYDAYRFCPHGIVCFLPHVPPPPPPRGVDALIAELDNLDREHDASRSSCRVCGSPAVHHFGFDRVLPMAMCTVCCQTLYCPLVPELAESIFETHSRDYQAYKTVVDEVRERIPNAFRIPFTKEAHRIGCSKFAWSLVSDEQVAGSLRAVLALNPATDCVLSVGASSGYVEYLYKVSAERQGHAVRIEAYDEIPNPRFDVVVQRGGPEQALRCDRRNTALLLCWPPFGSQEKDLSTMGFDTLTNFLRAGGNTVIYIGDESSTGDFRFHALLAQTMRTAPGYRVRQEIRRWVPQDMGMVFAGQDSIGVYVKRPVDPATGLPSVMPLGPTQPLPVHTTTVTP